VFWELWDKKPHTHTENVNDTRAVITSLNQNVGSARAHTHSHLTTLPFTFWEKTPISLYLSEVKARKLKHHLMFLLCGSSFELWCLKDCAVCPSCWACPNISPPSWITVAASTPEESKEGESPHLTLHIVLWMGGRTRVLSNLSSRRLSPLLAVGYELLKVTEPVCFLLSPPATSCHRSSHLPILFCHLAQSQAADFRAAFSSFVVDRLPTMFAAAYCCVAQYLKSQRAHFIQVRAVIVKHAINQLQAQTIRSPDT